MDKILILDFGSQYTQLIARRVREMHVYSELHSHDVSEEEIKAFNPKGIILSGGPNSVYESDTPIAPPIVFELGIPVLAFVMVCKPWQRNSVAKLKMHIHVNLVMPKLERITTPLFSIIFKTKQIKRVMGFLMYG